MKMTEREGRRLALLFLLSDVGYSLMFDLESSLKAHNMGLKQESKYRFNQMLADMSKAKKSCLRATSGVGEQAMDNYIEDSDYLREVLELVYDKTLANEENQARIKEMLTGLVNDKTRKV